MEIKNYFLNIMKKILLVTRPITPPWDEGSKNFAFFLAKNISDFKIGLLTKGELSYMPDSVLQKPIYTQSDFSWWQKVRLILKLRTFKKEFNILHFLFTPTKQNSFLVKNFIKNKKDRFHTIQTIATLREDLFSEAEIKKMLFGDMLITYSDYTKKKLLAMGFRNVERIYPGIDLDIYKNTGKNPEYLQKYSFAPRDFIINFTGEYIRNDAMDTVVQSFLEIAKLIPEAKLSLAVRIKNKKDAAKKKEVFEIFKQNNLLNRVAFHDDGLYDVFELYNMADISIFPVKNMQGKFDVPLAVIEAMACEKPVIISDLPLLREFAKEENSVRIEKGSVQKLNEAILDLYSNPEKRTALGKNAREFVQNNFDIKNVAEQYKNIYNKFLKDNIMESAYKLNSLSANKKELRTEKMKIPAVLHVSDDLLPSDKTLSEIESLAGDQRLFHHVAEMSDVHSKKGRKVPTGSVVATEKFFLPQINDTAPNCGMRLVKTNLFDNEVTSESIDRLFQELVKVVPTKKYIGTPVPYRTALNICFAGAAPLLDHFKIRTKNEITNAFANGNFFRDEAAGCRDILDSVPELFIKIGSYRLGILGAAGNHFLDLMKISEIKNPEIAEKFGLKTGQYVFLIHTGSGLMGQYASYMYTPKKKEHLSQQIVLKIGTTFFGSQMKKVYQRLAKKIEAYKNKEEFFGYEDDSMEGRMFWNAHRAAANFGFANRIVITHHLDNALEKVFGKQVELDLLYDTTHISIEKENHFGQNVWVHRNGSVRAFGPARMQDHPLFKETGEPVFIPSSMSTAAYIGVGTDNNESTFFSAPHGTGRRKHHQENAAKNKKELFQKMQQSKVKLYNAASKGVILQDSSYYKDVEKVISGLEENNIINVVAKMEPVAVLMY